MLPTLISTATILAARAASPGGLATLVVELIQENLGTRIFDPATRTRGGL
jgi:hypothetical protein